MSAKKEYEFELIFDGGSKGNPGKGYGSFQLTTNGLEQPVRTLDFGDNVTNNQAEYLAMIAGVKDALRLMKKYDIAESAVTLRIKTDSKLVAEQVSGRWKVKNEQLKPLKAEALAQMKRFKKATIKWHSRTESVRVLGH
jgi:ribonuclease HI